MNPRRNCCEVISHMMRCIPEDRIELITDLKWNYDDAWYKAPEETIQWQRTSDTLYKHIPIPKEDWEFEILSIFSMQSVADIKFGVAEYLAKNLDI